MLAMGWQKQTGLADLGKRYHQPTTTGDKRRQAKQLPPTQFSGRLMMSRGGDHH
jgi:hypothetical protein